jgi:hypothetical protein
LKKSYKNAVGVGTSASFFCLKEINKIIDSLKSKDFSGYNEISTKIVKISKSFIISPLINRFNKVLAQGED